MDEGGWDVLGGKIVLAMVLWQGLIKGGATGAITSGSPQNIGLQVLIY